MLKERQLASLASTAGQLPTGDSDDGEQVVYWHRELPPLHAEPAGEHMVEANSLRVTGRLAHRGDVWDRCYQDLMAQLHERLCQEVHRLGGHYAHVLEEAIDSRHDDRSGEAWLRGRRRRHRDHGRGLRGREPAGH